MSLENQKHRLAAVIGYPIGHSLSPHIHRIWAAREGRAAFYVPIQAGPTYEEFAAACDHLRALGFSGANVTIPHKENALRYCDEVSENARLAGAANMVTFREDKTCADNSDIIGFKDALAAELNDGAPKTTALMLGAGGAARGVFLALKALGYEKILISNRTKDRAKTLADDLGGEVIDWAARLDALKHGDVIVNTTSLGMAGAPRLDLPLKDAKQRAVICDIVYTPLMTPLLQDAKSAGLKTVDGLSMLIRQAVPGYQTWLGQEALVDDDLRRQLIDILNARG